MPKELEKQLAEFREQYGKFDYIVHNAGITKADKASDYMRVNCEYTKSLIDTLIASDMVPQKFVFISSLAAYGPGDEKEFNRITTEAPPHPITAYGRSKLQAEAYLQSHKNFPYLILRPTAVYGPRAKFIMAYNQFASLYHCTVAATPFSRS